MKFIGITGGVGAGKSEVLAYIRKKDGVRVMLADEIAHKLMEPGTECYEKILRQFPEEKLCLPDGNLDRGVLAHVIFTDEQKRLRMNGIVHPAVKEYVARECRRERERKQISWLFLEAALLIEEGYKEVCDELWYIWASEETRRKRLKEARGYSDERTDGILASQLTEEQYRKACQVVIDNDGDLSDTYIQIDQLLM